MQKSKSVGIFKDTYGKPRRSELEKIDEFLKTQRREAIDFDLGALQKELDASDDEDEETRLRREKRRGFSVAK